MHNKAIFITLGIVTFLASLTNFFWSSMAAALGGQDDKIYILLAIPAALGVVSYILLFKSKMKTVAWIGIAVNILCGLYMFIAAAI